MKNALIVSYHFPPDAAIGAVRAAEFAKQLPDLGWDVMVLSVQSQYYDQLDVARYQKLSTVVERTVKAGSINDVYFYLKSWSTRFRRRAGAPAVEKEWFVPISKGEGLKARVLRYYNSLLIYLPDKEIGWIPFAVWRAVSHKTTGYRCHSHDKPRTLSN